MVKKEKDLGKKNGAEKVVELILAGITEKKGIDVKVLNVSKRTTSFDYMLICGAEAEPHLRALEKEIDKILRKNKIKGFRWQGVVDSGWVVLDLGNVVLHLMTEAERKYYNLEDLWEKDAITYHY